MGKDVTVIYRKRENNTYFNLYKFVTHPKIQYSTEGGLNIKEALVNKGPVSK